ncbi:ABC transporter family substrate-binding protein [Parasphingorhabdus pacifica]
MFSGRRRPAVVGLLFAVLSLVVSCTNAPPPPLVDPPATSDAPPDVPTTQPMPTEVVVGVDTIEGGFNPHTLADLSPTSSALSSLMLPSVFRPDENGELRLDTTLMESAEVVPDAEKFTVRYRIRTEANWSDGGPIAAEDFVYLWQQLRSQPGVTDPAGYRLIEDVASHAGGKTVEVTFAQPYPGWKSLFTNLLPAHLLKDSPGGWTTALDEGYPASGGPFRFRQVDLDRGVIVLERNDRYYGTPSVSDRIVLRANDKAGQVAALRSGDSHLAVFGADRAAIDSLRALGESVQITTIPRPATMQVLLRPTSPNLAETKVRRAVAAAVDRDRLIEVGSDGGPADQLHAHSQVLAPSERGYRPTEPAGNPSGDPADVARLLTESGYQRSGGVWMRDGKPLNLVIAAPFEHQQYVRIAEETARQLTEQGIRATAVTPTGDELFTDVLADNPLAEEPGPAASVDMAITPRPAGGDPASMMASAYGCPSSASESDPSSLPYNPAGFCDELLQPTIEAAMTGRLSFEDASAKIESVLWSRAIALPLYQQAQVLVQRRDVSGVQEGNGLAGPFSTAADWKGTPAEDDGW